LFSALPGDYEDYTPPTIRKENWKESGWPRHELEERFNVREKKG
jgi:hypothetical protein